MFSFEKNIPILMLGDVEKCLKNIPDETISCIVTSPPYWNLRDYENDGQIGQEKTADEYIEKIVNISKEFLRILKKDGALFLNIGDTYVDKGLQMIPQRIAAKMISEINISQNNKKIGWLLRNQIIWFKPDHMPSPVKCRFTNTYEVIYFFSRNDWEKDLFFNIDAIRIPYKTEQNLFDAENDFPEILSVEEYRKLLPRINEKNGQINYNGKFKNNEKNIGASPGGRNSVSGIRYVLKRKVELEQKVVAEYLRGFREKINVSVKELEEMFGYKYTVSHWFRTDKGGSLPSPKDWLKLKEILHFDEKFDSAMTEVHYVLQTIRQHPNGKNPGDLWTIQCAKNIDGHFAVFPEEIPRQAILACCPEDGIVLDPFAGSGTTGKVAKELNRKCLLIEIQENFVNLIEKRCGKIKILKMKK